MLSKAVLQKSFRVKDIKNGYHISCVDADRAWITGSSRNLILTDELGETLDCLTDIDSTRGNHSVTQGDDLIYIDENYNINKLSATNKTKIPFIKASESWTARCICVSRTSGDLLVGMLKKVPGPAIERGARIARYNAEGQETQSIQYTCTGRKLFTYPVYIAENLNGDVIESDWNRVVGTDREGEIRFCYPDNRHEELSPWGICTDSLLHILICDTSSYTVRMLDKDGYFLQYLLTTEDGITEFRSLSYDYKNDLLWVGSLDDNTVSVFEYIEKENTPQDNKVTIKEKAIEKDFSGTKPASTSKISETEDATQVTETGDTTNEAETRDTTEVSKTENTEDTREMTDTKEPTEVAETYIPS